MLVNEFLEGSADRFPGKTALVCQGRRYTFADLENSANRFSHALTERGLGRQDRAAVFLDPSPEAIVSVFAILKAGGVFLVINPQVKAKKVEYILNDCQVKILVTDSKHLQEIAGHLPGCPGLCHIVLADHEASDQGRGIPTKMAMASYADIQTNYPASRPPKKCIDIDLASLIYTSGSTGTPKGVMLTHLNMVSAANSITEYLENTPEDIILNVLPLSFDYGLYQILMAFKFGGTVVQERSFLYFYEVIDQIIKEKVTGFPVVPTIVALLLKLKNLEKYNFSKLRYITNTAQALPPHYISELRRIFPCTKIYSMYGLTECKRVSYLPPAEIDRRPTSVGKAMPNSETFLVDPEGNRIIKPWEIGELVIRGANVMAGYWNLPQETDKVLKPGLLPGQKVLYSGDYFKMDEEGFLYFISRKDDLLKVVGERISPKEVENGLYDIEGVAEAAVVGVPDEITGQAIKAFIALKKGSHLTADEIIKWCSKHMERYMVPKFVEFREELPKSSHGKISKKDLA
jgi:amino acid adenylation domain-containing protein